MKREILFRGKSVGTGEWLYGHLFNYGLTAPSNVPCICVCVPKSWKEAYSLYTVHPETIGQYTGLKDKNGKKIFEGDILDYTVFDVFGEEHQCKGVVKWVDDCLICDSSDGFNGFAWVVKQSIELDVIGNVTDNPELMK